MRRRWVPTLRPPPGTLPPLWDLTQGTAPPKSPGTHLDSPYLDARRGGVQLPGDLGAELRHGAGCCRQGDLWGAASTLVSGSGLIKGLGCSQPAGPSAALQPQTPCGAAGAEGGLELWAPSGAQPLQQCPPHLPPCTPCPPKSVGEPCPAPSPRHPGAISSGGTGTCRPHPSPSPRSWAQGARTWAKCRGASSEQTFVPECPCPCSP